MIYYVYVMIYIYVIYSISLKPFCKKTRFKPSGKHRSMHAPQIFNSTKKTWFLVVFEISIPSFALPEMSPKQCHEMTGPDVVLTFGPN